MIVLVIIPGFSNPSIQYSFCFNVIIPYSASTYDILR